MSTTPATTRDRTDAVASAIRTTRQRIKDFGPLLSALGMVIVITLAVLPSSLNLPQSNPSTILEYAPVPPDDDSPPPIQSGLSSLGIAGSSSLRTGIGPPPELPDPTRDIPPLDAQKRCVSGRQTEDLSSPPCQGFFTGNNGGSTWQGVTGDEVVVLIYNQVGNAQDTNNGRREGSPSSGTYCDVDTLDCWKPPAAGGNGESTGSERHVWMRLANAFSRYFNARYQTYGRHVHFYYYWTGADTASARRGDAADNWEILKPFAVIDQTWWGGHNEVYAEAMAFRDVMVVSGIQTSPRRSFFQNYAPKVWSYWPDVENWADMFSAYLCQKVHGTNVTDAGAPYMDQPRKYGLMYTTDPAYKNLIYFKDLVVAAAKGCGMLTGQETEVTFPQASFTIDNSGDQTYGQTNAAKLRDNGVNTVIWFGGTDTKTTPGAGRIGYYPQWIVAGDRELDGASVARFQDQAVWDHAWVQSYQLREEQGEANPAYQSYKEAEPDGTDTNWADNFYRDFFMMFMMVQVSGPKLSPDGVDAGMHAIQRRDSTSPYVASCYFFPRDFSCVKDATEFYWDSQPETADGRRGCYRLVRGGQRYARDRWDSSRGMGVDVPGYLDRNDPCSNYDHGWNARLA